LPGTKNGHLREEMNFSKALKQKKLKKMVNRPERRTSSPDITKRPEGETEKRGIASLAREPFGLEELEDGKTVPSKTVDQRRAEDRLQLVWGGKIPEGGRGGKINQITI